jgi:hypothetical protein
MEVKASQMTLWDVFYSHHMNNKESGYVLDLKVGHKCNESTQKLKDGPAPNLVHNAKEKTSKANRKMK